MTEPDWQSCSSPEPMLAFLRDKGASERKLRLFTCACCRDVWDLILDLEHANIGYGCVAVELAERLADGKATREAVAAAVEDRVGLMDSGSSSESRLLHIALPALAREDPFDAARLASLWTLRARYRAATNRAMRSRGERDRPSDESKVEGEKQAVEALARRCGFIRDIFGNPFRPVAFDPEWRTSPVIALAARTYVSREFSLMPILADALQDAGCENADILTHCRGDGPHVRGCWVVDLVLGKS